MGRPGRCMVNIRPREIGIKDFFGAMICGGELLGEKNTVFLFYLFEKYFFAQLLVY